MNKLHITQFSLEIQIYLGTLGDGSLVLGLPCKLSMTQVKYLALNCFGIQTLSSQPITSNILTSTKQK